MHYLRKSRISCWILAFAALATFPDAVSATSCIRDRSTLAERYATANAIVVAQANSCRGPALADGSRCPGEEYQFGILEVLKDSEPSRDHSSTLIGRNSIGIIPCGLVFRLGQSYLLFLEDDGQPIHRFTGHLNDEYPGLASTKDSVRILREYRDNIIDDLSGPWTFYDSGLSCEIRHRFKGASISLSFQYKDQEYWYETLHGLEGTGPRGEALFRTENRRDKHRREEYDTTFKYDGPDFERETVFVRVDVENRKDASDGFVSLSLGKWTWQLNPMTVTISGSAVSTSVHVSDMLGSDDALSFFRNLTGESKEITLITNQTNDVVELKYPKVIKTRSTQFTRSVASFDQCISGEKRRGAIITRQ
jgi:hypothetical protein